MLPRLKNGCGMKSKGTAKGCMCMNVDHIKNLQNIVSDKGNCGLTTILLVFLGCCHECSIAKTICIVLLYVILIANQTFQHVATS